MPLNLAFLRKLNPKPASLMMQGPVCAGSEHGIWAKDPRVLPQIDVCDTNSAR